MKREQLTCFFKNRVARQLQCSKSISQNWKKREHLIEQYFLFLISNSIISNSLFQLLMKIDKEHLNDMSFDFDKFDK